MYALLLLVYVPQKEGDNQQLEKICIVECESKISECNFDFLVCFNEIKTSADRKYFSVPGRRRVMIVTRDT